MLQNTMNPSNHVSNKLLSPDKFVHHVPKVCSSLYRNKMQEKGFQNVINISKINFEPF